MIVGCFTNVFVSHFRDQLGDNRSHPMICKCLEWFWDESEMLRMFWDDFANVWDDFASGSPHEVALWPFARARLSYPFLISWTTICFLPGRQLYITEYNYRFGHWAVCRAIVWISFSLSYTSFQTIVLFDCKREEVFNCICYFRALVHIFKIISLYTIVCCNMCNCSKLKNLLKHMQICEFIIIQTC